MAIVRSPIQTELFSRPIARTSDPETSHKAAQELASSGQLGAQKMQTLRALAAWPGDPPTSAELSDGDIELRFRYARRLADLREDGLVEHAGIRKCRQTTHESLTWVLTLAGKEAVNR